MINPALLTDDLANKMAEEVICIRCAESIEWHIARRFAERTKELLDNIMPSVNELRRQAHFEALFKSLIPYEKLYKTMLRDVWAKEEKIVIANLKKMKKAWLTKDKIDDILYPVSQFEKELSENALEIDLAIIDKQGNIEMGKLAAVDVVFDVSNPEVQKWLKSYTPKFSKELEKVSVAKLRRELTEGIAEGEGIPGLLKRVNTTYKHWNKVRSETIARSEALRASNRASIEAYKQSGVVKKKVWITHFSPETCAWCRRLNNKVISIEKSFFTQGSRFAIDVEGKRQTMKLDYEDVESPPLHPRCRCTIAASFEEVTETKPVKQDFHKKITAREKKLLKDWSDTEYGHIRSWTGMTPDEKKRLLDFYKYDKHKQAWITKQLKDADDFMALFKKYRDGVRSKILYRSISKIKDKIYNPIKSLKPGEVFKVDRTISSWSYDKKILNKFTFEGENNIHFILDKGRTTLMELDIEKYSKLPFEKEVLMGELEFEIVKIKETVLPLPSQPKFKTKILEVYLKEKGG